jgi:hypothetical protein
MRRPDLDEQARALFVAGIAGQDVRGRALNRPARENGRPVLSALKIDRFAKNRVHAGETAQFGCLVDTAGSLGAVIDLLQGRHIGVGIRDHGGDPGQIQAAICPFAMMYVIG